MSLTSPRATRSALAAAAAASLLGGSAAPAFGAPPEQDRDHLTWEWTYGAGDLCDVAVHERVEGQFHDTNFDDGGQIEHNRIVFTYTNLATGSSVTDTGRFLVRHVGDALVISGLSVRLQGPDGKMRGIDAGRGVLDAGTFEVISRSGHELGDYDAAVCGALGSTPAG
jgi:hypothetical protein